KPSLRSTLVLIPRQASRMSGANTRSHKSSVQNGPDATLDEISALLKARKSVVMITGAGLSAASGIPPFRGTSDAVWSVSTTSMGRRSTFLRDPLRWYNDFWLRQFPLSYTRKAPNAGHEAHQKTTAAWPDTSRLIEVHGRLGLYKCVSEEAGCPFAEEKEIPQSSFTETVQRGLEGGADNQLEETPSCPFCGRPASPMALLFDEDYDSHSFFEFERAQEWMAEADAFIFVGTSYAVTLT
ncbi:unnamed protein product, partial [Discosporangium mesarthrocarpum]